MKAVKVLSVDNPDPLAALRVGAKGCCFCAGYHGCTLAAI